MMPTTMTLPRRILLLEERRDHAIAMQNMRRAHRLTTWLAALNEEQEASVMGTVLSYRQHTANAFTLN